MGVQRESLELCVLYQQPEHRTEIHAFRSTTTTTTTNTSDTPDSSNGLYPQTPQRAGVEHNHGRQVFVERHDLNFEHLQPSILDSRAISNQSLGILIVDT